MIIIQALLLQFNVTYGLTFDDPQASVAFMTIFEPTVVLMTLFAMTYVSYLS